MQRAAWKSGRSHEWLTPRLSPRSVHRYYEITDLGSISSSAPGARRPASAHRAGIVAARAWQKSFRHQWLSLASTLGQGFERHSLPVWRFLHDFGASQWGDDKRQYQSRREQTRDQVKRLIVTARAL